MNKILPQVGGTCQEGHHKKCNWPLCTCLCHKKPLAIGDHVRKISGMKFVGTVLARYKAPPNDEWWLVVLLDKNEASDSLQHLYRESQFEKVHNPPRPEEKS